MRVNTQVKSNLTTIIYVITAIVGDEVELKLSADSRDGIIISKKELTDRYTEVQDIWATNFYH